MFEGKRIKIVLGLFMLIGFFYFLSFAGVNEILTPVRIDSVYVKAQEADYLRQQEITELKIRPHFFYSPADFNMCYNTLSIRTADSLNLKGWYIPSDNFNNSTTILILPDLNESRITVLETAKQFHDRGYSVCLFDMRAHGASEGKQVTFGFLEKYDVQTITDTLFRQYGSKNLVLMGLGVGAVVALQTAVVDSRVKLIVAQSPFNNLTTFVKSYAAQKWGPLTDLIFPLIQKHIEKELLFPLQSIDLVAQAKKSEVPVLFIAGAEDQSVKPTQTHQIFVGSAATKKQFWLVRNASHSSIEEIAGETYYNKISVFIINNSPKKIAKTRFKKFV